MTKEKSNLEKGIRLFGIIIGTLVLAFIILMIIDYWKRDWFRVGFLLFWGIAIIILLFKYTKSLLKNKSNFLLSQLELKGLKVKGK